MLRSEHKQYILLLNLAFDGSRQMKALSIHNLIKYTETFLTWERRFSHRRLNIPLKLYTCLTTGISVRFATSGDMWGSIREAEEGFESHGSQGAS